MTHVTGAEPDCYPYLMELPNIGADLLDTFKSQKVRDKLDIIQEKPPTHSITSNEQQISIINKLLTNPEEHRREIHTKIISFCDHAKPSLEEISKLNLDKFQQRNVRTRFSRTTHLIKKYIRNHVTEGKSNLLSDTVRNELVRFLKMNRTNYFSSGSFFVSTASKDAARMLESNVQRDDDDNNDSNTFSGIKSTSS